METKQMTEQDKIDFGITEENLKHFIMNNEVKFKEILENNSDLLERFVGKSEGTFDTFLNRKIVELDLIPRSKAFTIALHEDLEALTDEDIDVDEFATFLDQETHQIEDALKEAWENWKEEQD